VWYCDILQGTGLSVKDFTALAAKDTAKARIIFVSVGCCDAEISGVTTTMLFFLLFVLACDLYRSWRRAFCPVFLSAVRAVAALCKLPFALRPGLSHDT